MLNLALMVAEIWLLSTLTLALHYISPRYGFAPLLVLIGGLTVIIQGQVGVYIEPLPNFILFLSSNVLIPVALLSVLVIYIADGAVPARMTIYCILGISLIVLLVQQMYRFHLGLPGGGAVSEARTDVLFPPLDLRVTAASLIAFASDLLIINLCYQTLRNRAAFLPDWLVIGLTLLAGLWTDSLVFSTVADFGQPDFGIFLPGDLAGKTLSALALWPGTAFYLIRVAPQLPGYLGARNRRSFDLLLGSIEDIKLALVRTEAALQASELRRQREGTYLRLISENVQEALWLSDPNQLNAYYVNAAYEKIWGRSAQAVYADPMAYINSVHPDDQEAVLAYLVNQVIGPVEIEYRLIRPDGEVRWVRERAFPVRDESGAVTRVAGITEDVTERKLAEQRRIELAIEQGKVQLLRNFISETSEDFKNPLTALHLRAFQLAHTDEAEKRLELLEELRKLIVRMHRSLEEVLTLARLESTTELPVIHWQIQNFISEQQSLLFEQMREKNLRFEIELATPSVRLRADREDLERAVAHLLENAVTYTPTDGVVRIQVYLTHQELVWVVSDSGIGIPADDLPHIFNRFYRGAIASQMQPAGTGLGLAIVNKVVEQHHGRLEVTSHIASGATFTLYLPLAA